MDLDQIFEVLDSIIGERHHTVFADDRALPRSSIHRSCLRGDARRWPRDWLRRRLGRERKRSSSRGLKPWRAKWWKKWWKLS